MKQIILNFLTRKKGSFLDNFFFIIRVAKLKRQFTYSMVIAIISAFFETMSIYTIGPFMQVVSAPDYFIQKPIVSKIYNYLNFSSPSQMVYFMGICLILFLLSSNFVSYLKEYIMGYAMTSATINLSQRLFKGYLMRDYSFFLTRHSSDFIRNINSYTSEVASKVTYSFSQLLASLFSILLIVSTVIFANPFLAVFMFGSILLLYMIIMRGTKGIISSASKEKINIEKSRDKVIVESFASIKDVKSLDIEDHFFKNYSSSSQSYKNTVKTSNLISLAPKKLTEALIFSIIIGFILFSYSQTSFAHLLPSLTLYVFAAYRLLPHIGIIYETVVKIKYGREIMKLIVEEFEFIQEAQKQDKKDHPIMPFNNSIDLKNISYSYPINDINVVSGISIQIKKNQLIGIIGKTGSGKTTLIDLIMGLIEPAEGGIYLDGIKITKDNVKGYRKLIGYVPQNVALSSLSVAENIAFGKNPEEIDYKRIEEIAKKIDLDEFVKDMPDKYNEIIGERGVRLSGGQKQRIGIARALYVNPQILIFDEATSALDNQTEALIMNAIENISKDITVIMIAHRLTTLRKCDVVYKIEKGKVVDSGTPNKFINADLELQSH